MFYIFTYSSSTFSLISFQTGTKFCSRQGGQAAWKLWQQLPSYPFCPPAQDLPLRTPEPTSFLSSPGDVLQQVLIPNTLLCPPRKLPLGLNILLIKETKRPSLDCPHSWSGTLLASGVWATNQKNTRHSQALLKEWRWKDTKGLQWTQINWENTDAWLHLTSPDLESLQTETQAHFLASPQWPKMHPWLRITHFYHQIEKNQRI